MNDNQEGMTGGDVKAIMGLVVQRLEKYLPSLQVLTNSATGAVRCYNPDTKKGVDILQVFTIEQDCSIGYRVFTVEAVPTMLQVLLEKSQPVQVVEQSDAKQ